MNSNNSSTSSLNYSTKETQPQQQIITVIMTILEPQVKGLACGMAHIVVFHFLRKYFEKKAWL